MRIIPLAKYGFSAFSFCVTLTFIFVVVINVPKVASDSNKLMTSVGKLGNLTKDLGIISEFFYESICVLFFFVVFCHQLISIQLYLFFISVALAVLQP